MEIWSRFPSGLRNLLGRTFGGAVGYAMSEDRLLGVAVTVVGKKSFARLLDGPHAQPGWAVPMEPIRFFARRTSVPREFKGREMEYVRYNRPELIPAPDSQSLVLRFNRLQDGEIVFHGIRDGRLEPFLESLEKAGRVSAPGAPIAGVSDAGRMPKLSGIIPPSVAIAAALKQARPELPGRTLVVLVGARTTRYIGLRNGDLVNVFDDVHRAEASAVRARFRKTLTRVMYYMENEGLGGNPDAVILLGNRSIRSWTTDILVAASASRVVFDDLPEALGLSMPDDCPADMAILALGAALASQSASVRELNFIGIPQALAARRFDAFDMVIYGSLAAMLALSFVSVNTYISSRILTLKSDLLSNSQKIQALREDVESKRGSIPVAEKIVQISAQRVSDHAPAGAQILSSLPEFLTLVSESIPAGVFLDRMGNGSLESIDPASAQKSYRSIFARPKEKQSLALIGQTRSPDRAIAWVDQLARRLGTAVRVDEMKLDGASGAPSAGDARVSGANYRFRIVVSTDGKEPGA